MPTVSECSISLPLNGFLQCWVLTVDNVTGREGYIEVCADIADCKWYIEHCRAIKEISVSYYRSTLPLLGYRFVPGTILGQSYGLFTENDTFLLALLFAYTLVRVG